MAGKRKAAEEDTPAQEESMPEYTFKDGYRFVKEYTHKFKVFTKRRWIGMKLWDVLLSEFKLYSKEHFEEAFSKGNITVNGAKREKSYQLIDGDLIEHTLARNERRVFHRPIQIIYEDEKFVVVNKPSSIPVHPCGAFYYNSLSKLLEYELGYKNLLMGHRLDRQTSGICLFSKSKQVAHDYSQNLTDECVHKVYLARVMGKITEKKFEIKNKIYVVSAKDAIHDCTAATPENGKDAAYRDSLTMFKVVGYDEKADFTILKCYLKTGRTHQIRVHVKSIGHPIENDKIYRTIYELEKSLGEKSGIEKEKPIIFKDISCRINPQGRVIPDVCGDDFEELYLHAYKYKFGKYKFKTPYPDWALLPPSPVV